MLLAFFFFSSRRRHTRWPRDWSSDVCSSDLPARLGWVDGSAIEVPRALTQQRRSEERRVGKECRTRWGEDEEKKKTKKRDANEEMKEKEPHEERAEEKVRTKQIGEVEQE